MTKNSVLASKPQFDTKMFEPGTAVRIDAAPGQGGCHGFKANCLVSKCTPLELTLEFIKVDEVRGDVGFDSQVLPVECVSEELVNIEILRRP